MKERLTVAQAAELVGVTASTWRAYVARDQAPKPDGEYDRRTPWWYASTVKAWHKARPGRGRRST